MMDKLRECPFCGGEARLEQVSTKGIAMMPVTTWFRVRCWKCSASVESHNSVDAIESWNRRENDYH